MTCDGTMRGSSSDPGIIAADGLAFGSISLCDSSSLTRWRKRLGEEGCEIFFDIRKEFRYESLTAHNINAVALRRAKPDER